jgi:hypothetical protein
VFLILAPTTGMRKGEILARKWTDIDLDSKNPSIYVRIAKNREPKGSNFRISPSMPSGRYPAMATTSMCFPQLAYPRSQMERCWLPVELS